MADPKKIKQYLAQRDIEITKMEQLQVLAKKAVHDANQHATFQCRYKSLDSTYETFMELNNKIIIVYADNGDELVSQKEILIKFDTMYYEIQGTYTSLFESKNLVPVNVAQAQAQNISPSTPNAKLPKIEISVFDGNLKMWQTFIDMFDSLIHNNACISNIEKFNYLLTYLKGPPLSLVKCTPLTANNYVVAYQALKKRYDNSRLIAHSHWVSLESTKKLSNSENAIALRTLLDTFLENLSVLKNLGYPTDSWDFILFNMLMDRLDQSTATRFELECGSDLENVNNRNRTFEILIEFLNKQCVALDTVSFTNNCKGRSSEFEKSKNNFKYDKKSNSANNNYKARPTASFVANANSPSNSIKKSCQFCTQEHDIYNCSLFLAKTPAERFNLTKERRWCTNCLGTKHSSFHCNSKMFCQNCMRKHHTLLHLDVSPHTNHNVQNNKASSTPNNITEASPLNAPNKTSSLISNLPSTTLLSTAIVEVKDACGNFKPMRALLDSASQSNFITSKCFHKLSLTPYSLSINICGIAQTNSRSTGGCECTIKPVGRNDPLFNLDFIILPQICHKQPSSSLSVENFSQFSDLNLADPKFHKSSPVDLLLGADIFGFLLKGNSISSSIDKPIALDTIFGWIVMGKIKDSQYSTPSINTLLTTHESSLENSIKKFWALEEVPSVSKFSSDDLAAEERFKNTTFKNSEGKYVVELPFKGAEPSFSGSRDIALKRFISLEKRLLRDPSLHAKYSECLKEYLVLNQMKPVSPPTGITNNFYYIPHHCVIKAESSTTKHRVVFDASAVDSNNKSLNDCLLTGPKLQQDIISILLKFRLPSIVFTADIKQMYRQILINPKHTPYQRILYRFSPSEPIRDFELQTVTFGVSSSPYLALRTIQQVAQEQEKNFPLACETLQSDIFIDDLLSGQNSLEEAKKLQKDLISVLKTGNFVLRKWASNNPLLISHLPPSDCQVDPFSLDLDSQSTLKVLGLLWNFKTDIFTFKVAPRNLPCTKRNMLSELARIYDPLGFLVPLTVTLKLLIQNCWASAVDWDSQVPQKILESWQKISSQLHCLSDINFPRQIIDLNNFLSAELHGMCDSSQNAYCAVVYLRVLFKDCSIKTHFIIAKSRIAPLKNLSIPRLELCSAVLLSSLLSFVQETYKNKMYISKVFAWTDSTIVLCWLKGDSRNWNTFVSNRVASIQEKIPSSNWHHIISQDNAADPGSRGLLPLDLLNNTLWRAGPHWLSKLSSSWPQSNFELYEPTEERRKITLSLFTEISDLDKFLNRFSSLYNVERCMCYILRFIFNCRHPKVERKCSNFSIFEMEDALLHLIKWVQHQCFSEEISALKSTKRLSKPFRKLTPFLDNDVLRVGGRLKHAKLAYDKKHPILLPSNHRLTDLIIEYTHKIYLHPGPQTLQYFLSQKYWIVSFKRTIRRVISKCHNCFRVNPISSQPLMGQLPLARLSTVKAFASVGVDYAGPFSITTNRIRGGKILKAYICLFVCMATKALHIELSSDLTSEAFLACLRRFIARRGRVNEIFSDRGTNFCGGWNEINKYMHMAVEGEKITWHFNPAAAPNFGGIWESGVRSVKTHLYKIIGQQILTYEELNTVLVQIEGVLNSRPLCPQSSDPNDLNVLTPGHFLTLEPLNSFPEPELGDVKMSRLSRWQLLQNLHQTFWKRFSHEYLHTLLQRSRWTDETVNINLDTLVLIKDENLPPLKWSMGRVTHVHPGKDGIVRVVTLRTTKGLIQRPVSKVCALPLN